MKIFERLQASRGWSGEELMVLEQVQRVADEVIAPNAARYDRSGDFPWDSVNAINDLGLNAIFVPEAFGGSPMRLRLYYEIVSIISEACASTGIVYATNYHAMKPLIDVGTDDQRRRLLPKIAAGGFASLAITEPTAGSDATGMKTRSTPNGEDIVIDGGKIFISNGDVADRILLFGKWSEIEDPKRAISVLVLEKGAVGFSVTGKEEKMGHRAASTCSLAFDRARAPRANLLGEPGDGLSILLSSLNKSRPSVAAQALGIARAAFKDMIAYSNERHVGNRRIVDFQANQFAMADLASELAMTEAWLDHVARLIEDGAEDYGLEASIAKMRASDLAMRMATACVQFHGGYGYCADYRAERLMRDAKITQVWEGANEVHRQLIGRSCIEK